MTCLPSDGLDWVSKFFPWPLYDLTSFLFYTSVFIVSKGNFQLSFPIDRSKAVPLLQFFFVRASVVPYVEFVLSFCAAHISFWASDINCCIHWVSFLI